jgi:site-specific DNA recombinase
MKNTGNSKQTAVIYTRVSTESQKDEGFSLNDQEAKLKTYCIKHNIEILEHYQDDHSAKTFNRPAFQRFMEDVRMGKIKPSLFLCVRIDRFSRNMMAGFEMIKELKSKKIEVRFLENNYELDSPESLIPYVLNMLLPQVENERRGLNTKTGMRQAVREGRWVWKAPLGYKNNRLTKLIEIDPATAPLIVEGFKMVEKGVYSADEVRMSLNAKGLKCSKQNFLNILRNVLYKGKLKIEAWKEEPEVIVNGVHKPLISEETFNNVQDVLNGKKKDGQPKRREMKTCP